MKFQSQLLSLALLCTTGAYALDATCNPVVDGFKNRIAQPAYKITNKSPMGDIYIIKINNKKYMGDAEEWELRPGNPDETDRQMINDIKNGEFPISECKILSDEEVDGRKMSVLGYILTLKMGPNEMKVNMKQYSGKKDKLVYKEEKNMMGQTSVTEYKYTDIKEPKL